jgi:hypothetical protein
MTTSLYHAVLLSFAFLAVRPSMRLADYLSEVIL